MNAHCCPFVVEGLRADVVTALQLSYSLNSADSVTPKQTQMRHVSWQKISSSLPARR